MAINWTHGKDSCFVHRNRTWSCAFFDIGHAVCLVFGRDFRWFLGASFLLDRAIDLEAIPAGSLEFQLITIKRNRPTASNRRPPQTAQRLCLK